jgi:hypothetical protein
MSEADGAAIAQIVNQSHPGKARFVQIDGMTHGFTIAGKFDDALVPMMLAWMRTQLEQ